MYNIIKKEILKSKLIIVSFIIMGIGFIILYNQVLIPRYTDVVYLRMVTYPVLLGIIVSICGYATFLNTEKYENKNNGYEFLKTLPVTKQEIYRGKIIYVLILNMFGAITMVLLNIILSADNENVGTQNMVIALFVSSSQLFVSLLFYMRGRMKFNRLYFLAFTIYILQLVIPQVMSFLLLINKKIDILINFFNKLSEISIIIPILFILTISFIFFSLPVNNLKTQD
jgi:hypothetical protein